MPLGDNVEDANEVVIANHHVIHQECNLGLDRLTTEIRPEKLEIYVSATSDAFNAYVNRLDEVLSHIHRAFPEVPINESIFDFGVTSLQLLRRIGELVAIGIPIDAVDIFQFFTPLQVSINVAKRSFNTKER